MTTVLLSTPVTLAAPWLGALYGAFVAQMLLALLLLALAGATAALWLAVPVARDFFDKRLLDAEQPQRDQALAVLDQSVRANLSDACRASPIIVDILG